MERQYRSIMKIYEDARKEPVVNFRHNDQKFITLVLLCFLRTFLPSFINILQNGRIGLLDRGYQDNLETSADFSSQSFRIVEFGFTTTISLFCVYLIFSELKTLGRIFASGITTLLLFYISLVIINTIDFNSLHLQAILFPLIVITTWVLKPSIKSFRSIAWCLVFVSAFSLFLKFFFPQLANIGYGFNQSKGIFGENLLAGPYSHPNQLGAVLSLGFPSLLLLKRKFVLPSSLICALALFFTGSRSPIISLSLTVLFALIFHNSEPRKFRVWTNISTRFALIILFILPLLVRSESFFSLRGRVWIHSLQVWVDRPIFGYGNNFFGTTGLVQSDLGIYASSGHNLFIDYLLKFGIVGALLLTLFLFQLKRNVLIESNDSQILRYWVLNFTINNIAESHFNIFLLNQTAFITFTFIAFIFTRERINTIQVFSSPNS